MKTSILCALFAAFLLSACVSSKPGMSLSEVKTRKTYNMDKQQLMELMKIYAKKKDFSVTRWEVESSRVMGYKNMQMLSEINVRRILMYIEILKVAEKKSEVVARFSYQSSDSNLTKEEEVILVELYIALFEFLDEEAKSVQ
ncbi:MAG: hypothetical protein V1799_11515 [bacterium]